MQKEEEQDLILFKKSTSEYEEITDEPPDNQSYQKNFNSIEFPKDTLIDLEQQSETVPSKTQLRNYDTFLLNRIIEVERPELIQENYLTSYKLYKIKSKKKHQQAYDTIVSRRFNDFEFLHHSLIQNFGGYVLPRLPQKNFLAKLNMESHQFQEERTKQLQRYIDKLLHHPRVRYSQQLKHFLFQESYNFSESKGEYIGQITTFDNLKNIVYDYTKGMYTQLLGSGQRRALFSKDNQQQMQLRVFERQVQDLIKVSKQIHAIVEDAHEELSIINEMSLTMQIPHLDSLERQQNFIITYQQLIVEFEDITAFISSCHDAILRTKVLRAQIEDLEQQQDAIVGREKQNPRNRQLDMIRNRLHKMSAKYDRWISSLKKELQVYTSEGKTMMGEFVKKFTTLKAQIYCYANDA